MHIILGILAIIGGAYFWLWRVRNAAEMASELVDAAKDVRLAARRFGFRRRTNLHPVESIEDAKLAGSGLLVAVIELDGLPTQDQRDAMLVQMQSVFGVSLEDAEEISVLGRWLVSQCKGSVSAIPRLAKALYKLAGKEALPDVIKMIEKVASTGGRFLSDNQQDALIDIRTAFRS